MPTLIPAPYRGKPFLYAAYKLFNNPTRNLYDFSITSKYGMFTESINYKTKSDPLYDDVNVNQNINFLILIAADKGELT